jgi:hypothetical protein
MSEFSNPQIAAIDDGWLELEPELEEFARTHGFTITRSHEGSFNVPRRWLRRELAGVLHEIGLIIASPMPERLERGFHPDILCTLYVAAFDRAAHLCYQEAVAEAEAFRSLRGSLRHHLAEALATLDACTREFIAHHGTHDPKG